MFELRVSISFITLSELNKKFGLILCFSVCMCACVYVVYFVIAEQVTALRNLLLLSVILLYWYYYSLDTLLPLFLFKHNVLYCIAVEGLKKYVGYVTKPFESATPATSDIFMTITKTNTESKDDSFTKTKTITKSKSSTKTT